MADPKIGEPKRRTSSVVIFVALLVGGLLLLATRLVVAPGTGVLDVVLPVVVGVLLAVGIGYMVARERRERKQMSTAEKNKPEHGMPP